jgi:hypothetical protein
MIWYRDGATEAVLQSQDQSTVVSGVIRDTQSACCISCFAASSANSARRARYIRMIYPMRVPDPDARRHAEAARRTPETGDGIMLKKFTVSAVLAAVVATMVSTAFASPRHNRPSQTVNRPVPSTGAEWWQTKGNSEDMGIVYRR